MKILEIKNNLVKISYDIDDNLALSGFVIIEDTNCPYVAQIVSLKADSAINTAIVKLLFTFDAEGVLKNYNGTIPSIKAAISKLPANELLDVLPVEIPIKLGSLAQQNIPLFVDKGVFEHNLVVCCNKQENTNYFIRNMLPQLNSLNQKTVVIDVDGEFDYENKFEFGYDFKLPLNYNTLNYIFDNDLGDVDAKSKAVIQDIFYEVQEYSKTLPHQFIPFNTFLEVVDAQYKETQIPELVLLKNKLLKYKDDNVFALNSVELTDLEQELQHNNITVLNISKVDGDLQRQVIYYLYEVMSKVKSSIYSMIKLDNYNASKKLIKRLLEGGNIQTTFICGHEFKYLQELKQYAENFIFFAPLTVQHDFAAYNTYLSKLNPEEFVVYGDVTQEIPFIVQLEEFSQEDLQPRVYYEEPTELTRPSSRVQTELPAYEETKASEPIVSEDVTPEAVNVDNEEEPVIEFTQTEEIPQDLSELNVLAQEQEEETDLPDSFDAQDVIQDRPEIPVFTEPEQPLEIASDKPELSETPQPVINEVIEEQAPEEAATFEPVEEQEDDIVVTPLEAPVAEPQAEETPFEPEPLEQEAAQDSQPAINEEQIIQDVDSLLYNKKDADEEIPPLEDDEEITEDDLNVIDNLNNSVTEQDDSETELNTEPVIVEDTDETSNSPQEETLPEDELPAAEEPEIQEEIIEENPVVPVYPANDIPEVSSEIFEAGDQVTHPKYGTGVVEKMIKYGNKVLCSINFENIGRRLLDPAISEITKI